MVTLTEINEQNWLDAACLRVTPEQQRFVAPAVGILARAYALRASNARAFGIAADGTLVGLLLVRDLTEPPACYELQQLLVDASAQNRGIAQSALTQLLAGRDALGWVGSSVTGLTQGYLPADSAGGGIRLVPVWLIETDTGNFFVNGITREVTAA